MTGRERIAHEEALLLATLEEFWASSPRPTPMGFLERFRGCAICVPHSDSLAPLRLIGVKTTADEKRRRLNPPKPEFTK